MVVKQQRTSLSKRVRNGLRILSSTASAGSIAVDVLGLPDGNVVYTTDERRRIEDVMKALQWINGLPD